MSRRKRDWLFTLCVVVLITVIWLDIFHGDDLRRRISHQRHWGLDGFKYHDKTFTVVNIVDGDTIDIGVPDGKFDNTRVRLLGMDTPETKSPKVDAMYFGAEATEFANNLVMGHEVVVVLDTVSDVRDMYGRLLAYIKLADGRVLNEELLLNGFAYADLRFEHSQFDRYVDLQEDAIINERGLWKGASRQDLPGWLQRERPDLLADRLQSQ